MQPAVAWMERHQVVLYLGALVAGAALGLGIPDVATPAENAVTPVLAALMFVTFLGVPFARIGRALRDGRFLWTLLAVNFVVVPAVVWPLSRLVAHDDALVFGVLLVLLTPCVDYVMVFTGLAHGATERLLAASPLLMLAQLVLLPGYLWLLGGRGIAAEVEPGPFIAALVFLIVLPLCAAGLVHALGARLRAVVAAQAVLLGAMVPLMMATLLLVVASQIRAVGRGAGSLLFVVPIFVAFALVMLVIGIAAGRLAGIDVPSRRALVFSGVTRNSLVVLPIALALPATLALTPLVVVSQTLVELVMMVVLVRVVPRLIPQPDPPCVSHP